MDHELETLKGEAFAIIEPHRVVIDDRVWGPKLGRFIDLPGGCEVHVDDELLPKAVDAVQGIGPYDDALVVPLVVDDPYLPPVKVLVSPRSLVARFNRIPRGSGPRLKAGRRRCTHPETNPPTARCDYCLWRWWTSAMPKQEAQ